MLVSEDGTLIGLIDWDNVHTVPCCIGYQRYPSWITRDWDPNKYGHGIPGCRTENSPEELEHFRKIYDIAVDLAEDKLDEDIEWRVTTGFQESFSIDT